MWLPPTTRHSELHRVKLGDSRTRLGSAEIARPRIASEALGRGAPGPRAASALSAPLPRSSRPAGSARAAAEPGLSPRPRRVPALFWRCPAGRAAERRAAPAAHRTGRQARRPRASPRDAPWVRGPGGAPGRALRGRGRGGARGAERPPGGGSRARRSLPPPVGAALRCAPPAALRGRSRPNPGAGGAAPRCSRTPKAGPHRGRRRRIPARAPAARGPHTGEPIINHQYLFNCPPLPSDALGAGKGPNLTRWLIIIAFKGKLFLVTVSKVEVGFPPPRPPSLFFFLGKNLVDKG